MQSAQLSANVTPPNDVLDNANAREDNLDDGKLTYDRLVQQLTESIKDFLDSERGEGRDPIPLLQMLHSHYSSRFLSDNERIWSTGSILIPISLAGFAALVALDDPNWPHVVVLMYGSVSLMFVWLMIAQAHKFFQRKSEAWLVAIERAIGFEKAAKLKLPRARIGSSSTLARVQTWRWLLLVLVVLGWLGALALTLLGWL